VSYFTFKDKEVFYQIDGDLQSNQEVIVILNGIMMSTKSWEPFVENLSKDHVLLRYDMFDQGQSATMEEDYSQAVQVDLLQALLRHLDISKANLVGISYGASIALQFAFKYPELVQRMIIANGVAKTSPWLKDIGDGWNEVAKTRNGLAYYHITIPYIYSPEFYTKRVDWMDKRKELLLPIFSSPAFLDRMIRLTKSAETHDVSKDLHQIKVPSLIISSEEDFLTPPYEQEYLKKHMPNAELVKIPNCGHASMYEVPKLFTALVLGFFDQASLEYQI